MENKKIRVLVVDDSVVVRRVLTKELSKFSDVDVVGSATDPYMAREKISELKPDVLTLDIEMPKMDGLSFLEKLMAHHPMPVIIVSSLAPENSDNAVRALALGAVDILSKPSSQFSTPDQNVLIKAIRTASKARILPRKPSASPRNTIKPTSQLQTTHKIVAIGASTGGTQAVEHVLKEFPVNSPGTVITQHMPAGFTKSFANRLNNCCKIEVREAKDGDLVVPGVALVAPGEKHMQLVRSGAQYAVVIKNGPAVNFQKPSVDVLFDSVAKFAGKNAVGAILTGMGSDGAKGLLSMQTQGAFTIAQNEETCVVYGMPKAAVNLNAANQIVPLEKVATTIFKSI